MYVNDIQNAFVNVTPKLFADVINVFIFQKDCKALYQLANTELESLNEWLLANKLPLSIGKDKDTKYTLFSPKKYPGINSLLKLHIAIQKLPFTTMLYYFL